MYISEYWLGCIVGWISCIVLLIGIAIISSIQSKLKEKEDKKAVIKMTLEMYSKIKNIPIIEITKNEKLLEEYKQWYIERTNTINTIGKELWGGDKWK